MSEDVWSARDTTPDAIEAALRELLRERHAANQALAPARVLNLVVIIDRDWKGEIANRMQRIGRYHASRTVLCAVEEGRQQLDATVVMSYDEPKEGGIGVIHELVEIEMGPEHLGSIDTIVDPVVVSDLPTLLWSPHGHEDTMQRLMGMVDVFLIDSDDLLEPQPALARATALLRSAYVVDLAWLRTTPWRERLAASFDPPNRRKALSKIQAIQVRHRAASISSGALLAGWLASRLSWEPECLDPVKLGVLKGAARRSGAEVGVELAVADQDAPGLAGVTVSWEAGCSLSLDRARGGLLAQERAPDGAERAWKVIGASRGEPGILGEGVRQALLRDPTYGPALAAARAFCPV